jgi:hypothetical protein
MVSSKNISKEKAVEVSFNGASTVGYFHDRRFLFPSNKPHPVSAKVSIFFFLSDVCSMRNRQKSGCIFFNGYK